MSEKLTAEDFIEVNNNKTNVLWQEVCDAELRLLDECVKLPRYGKKCNCNAETVNFQFHIAEKARSRPRQRCLECGGVYRFEEAEFKGEKFVGRIIGENRITIPEGYVEILKLKKGDMARVSIEKLK